MKCNIETTADGSPTLYRADIDEHYHSVKGALTEGRHVYIDMGWRAVSSSQSAVKVFEVGFGSGLNAALTAVAAMEERRPTEYFSVELYPLPAEITTALSSDYDGELRRSLKAVNEAPWDMATEINHSFNINKINADLLSMRVPMGIDVVYFDAFAPEKQPEMWTEAVFRKIYDAMSTGGVLTTYCAKGAVRRLLESVGFTCERLPGPPGGKREILRAVKVKCQAGRLG